jgi:diguanylate cyclase (GGDEF)-like protein
MALVLIFSAACFIAALSYLYLRLKNTKQHLHEVQAANDDLKHQLVQLEQQPQNLPKSQIGLDWTLFADRISQSINESARFGMHIGIVMLSIDQFEEINASITALARKQLLQESASRLQSCIRQIDSLSFIHNHFVILLTQLVKPENAAIVMQRLLAVFEQVFKIDDQEWHLRACIGISIYPNDGVDIPTLLNNAEYAMHLAKQKNGQHYQFYQEQLHLKSLRDLSLYNSLRVEHIFQELTLYYQPIINIQSDQVFCMEALLYWQHPQFGLILPAELRHYAKRQQTLNVLSEWALQQACQQFLRWRQSGFKLQYLGFTLSLKQLEQTQFIYRLSQILQENQFPPSSLLLQINGEIESIERSILEKSFNRLKYLGVKLAISHFGLGSLSLLHLKFFPLDYIKLDPLWLEELNDGGRGLQLIKAILFFVENISAQIIIQGVESKDQIKCLKEIGCLLMQGDVIAPPRQAAELLQELC